jgi:hypothetical protein
MNPDHADESDNDMPRTVYHALLKHNAMDAELCRTVAGEVWRKMLAVNDEIYGMWREEMRAARELERERDSLKAELAEARRQLEALKARQFKPYPYGPMPGPFGWEVKS